MNDSTHRITKLDPSVINKIAAGEVIHRPSHAIKELLENCLDAGATSIQIIVRDGGLKLLEITDNGHGIHREDLIIVAQRFTTSKLKAYNDLLSVSTFGFRGEALASLSHVAHLSITSRTEDSQCGYKGRYVDGNLISQNEHEPEPCAHPIGTTITVQDLFYNLPTRRKGMRSASEEYGLIADVVARYAVNYPKVAIVLRKQAQAGPDVCTPGTELTEHLDVIGSIYGSSVAREIVHVTHQFASHMGNMSAWISHPNFNTKGTMSFLLFINQRLVESAAMKRAIKALYARYLPKNTNPWVYLTLNLPAHTVDVNVHPTKKEVHFLHSEFILSAIIETFATRLNEMNTSRHFTVNVLTPTRPTSSSIQKRKRDIVSLDENRDEVVVAENPTPLVTDSVHQGNSEVVPINPVHQGNNEVVPINPLTLLCADRTDICTPTKIRIGSQQTMSQRKESQLVRTDSRATTLHQYFKPTTPHNQSSTMSNTPWVPRAGQTRDLQLTSISDLRTELEAVPVIPGILADHVYVGWVQDALVTIQSGVDLYLADISVLADDLYYRLALQHFSNYPTISFDPPIAIAHAVRSALDLPEAGWHAELAPKDDISTLIAQALISHKDMLADYFSLEVSEINPTTPSDTRPHLISIPQLQVGYVPPLSRVPMFLLRLGTEINWVEEKACLAGILDELAMFYTPHGADAFTCDTGSETKYKNVDQYTLEHVIMPAMRTLPMTEELAKRAFVRLANLHELYKVFERC